MQMGDIVYTMSVWVSQLSRKRFCGAVCHQQLTHVCSIYRPACYQERQ